ncbi:MAG: type I glyceraldehyde-3-phosphate dehydrogenase [Acidobacteria bacterium]|uniref:Glyceraldehyde-3-phosphate dehydrogenase n=1 Tax=Candidatus Polarisedimenticola svalbardensis TaxID=2886004 RepID=A0A8J6XUE2_9BACT|nr:type I glyceraldehyde-3-phosphate dehydrogenase [Candidatus Polarisedimenticola svalbardensis]
MSSKPKVAINGFGRIGRAVFRILNARDDMDVVAINDISDNKALAYLLKYDTVHGRFPGEIAVDDRTLTAGNETVQMLEIRDPADLPWKEMGVRVVIEATGRFRKRAEIAKHLEAGAERVILTVPAKDEIDATVVLGVNDHDLKPEHRIISNASCTTNCLAPMVKVLHENFGLIRGFITTVHAYTNDQRLADVPHTDLRRSRAAAENIIPTTTGAAKAVGKVMPELEGKLDGIAMRVPVPDGSTVDLVAEIEKTATVEAINAAMKKASEAGSLKGILSYSEEALVSSDIITSPFSAIFDAPSTRVLGKDFVKVVAWYDNEWGYSCRVVDLMERML